MPFSWNPFKSQNAGGDPARKNLPMGRPNYEVTSGTLGQILSLRNSGGSGNTGLSRIYKPAFYGRNQAICLASVSRAVQLISGTFTFMLCNGYYNTLDKFGNIIEDSRTEALRDLLVYSADGGRHSTSQIIEDAYVDYLTEGNGLLYVEFDGAGRVSVMKRICSWSAWLKRTEMKDVYRAEIYDWMDGAYRDIDHYNVVHARLPHLETIYGRRGYRYDFAPPPIQILRPAIEIGLKLDEYVFKFVRDGGTHQNLLVNFKEVSGVNDEQLSELYKEISREQSKDDGFLVFSDSAVDVKDVAPKIDPNLEAIRKYQVQEVARFYGIPSALLALDGPSVGSTVAELAKMLKTYGLMLWNQRFLDALSLRVLNPGTHIELDYRKLSMHDPVAMKTYVDMLRGDGQTVGIGTMKECRAAAMLSPEPEDELLNQTPVLSMNNGSINNPNSMDGGAEPEGESEDQS